MVSWWLSGAKGADAHGVVVTRMGPKGVRECGVAGSGTGAGGACASCRGVWDGGRERVRVVSWGLEWGQGARARGVVGGAGRTQRAMVMLMELLNVFGTGSRQ